MLHFHFLDTLSILLTHGRGFCTNSASDAADGFSEDASSASDGADGVSEGIGSGPGGGGVSSFGIGGASDAARSGCPHRPRRWRR